MPPKKSKVDTASKATVAAQPHAPIVTNRGKEIEATAAAARPRRSAGKATTSAATEKAASNKFATAAAASKKRGRPAKPTTTKEQDDDEDEEVNEPPKKRGRPAKADSVTASKKKPGRPAKSAPAAEPESPKKRGRPVKQTAPAVQEPAKRKGRPSRVGPQPEEAPEALDTPAPRKRHSGPTGGETTKIAADADNAAEQLEEELLDEAEKTANLSEGKNYWLMKAEQIDRMETLKSGREFNTRFTIDDLKNASVPAEPWEGVRNMVARNNMRAMKKGDLAFFYASQGKGKLQPGITGIIEIVKEHEPDFTVEDEDSIGYVEPAKRGKENQWSLVHVAFRKKLSEPVTLKELQKFADGNGVLKDMQVVKQSRLSVTKVSEEEWDFIVNNLIEGYEDEDAAPVNGGHDDAADKAVAGASVEESKIEKPSNSIEATDAKAIDDADGGSAPSNALPTVAQTDANLTAQPKSRTGSRQPSRAGSRQPSAAPPVLQEVAETVTAALKTGVDAVTQFAQNLSPEVAKPASRAGSQKPASRAGSLQPPSRAGSLDPTGRPASRGRTKTPQPALMPSLIE